MDNTVVVDSSLMVLSLLGGWLLSGYYFRTRETGIRKLPLFLMLFAGLWCATNWLAHLIAVLIVNMKVMLAGSFVYTYHFYSLLLMGASFLTFSLYQLSRIVGVTRGVGGAQKQLKYICWLIIAFSLPIFPLNPIGLLPVISSVIILSTMAATRKQWASPVQKVYTTPKRAVTA